MRTSTSLKKPDLLEIIAQRLGDPERVRAAIDILTPFERAALALIGWAGYPLEAGALTTGLRTAGVEMPKARTVYERDAMYVIQPLIRRGLLLNQIAQDPSSPGSNYERAVLFSDSTAAGARRGLSGRAAAHPADRPARAHTRPPSAGRRARYRAHARKHPGAGTPEADQAGPAAHARSSPYDQGVGLE